MTLYPCVFNIRSWSEGHTNLTGHNFSILVAAIVDLLVVVHPDLSQAHLVASDDLCAFGEGVGALGAEDMTHHRTRNDLQLTPTLPHLRITLDTHCLDISACLKAAFIE